MPLFKFLQNPTAKTTGNLIILLKRSERLIVCTVANDIITARKIGSQIEAPESVQTIRKAIKRSKILKNGKQRRSLCLTSTHKKRTFSLQRNN